MVDLVILGVPQDLVDLIVTQDLVDITVEDLDTVIPISTTIMAMAGTTATQAMATADTMQDLIIITKYMVQDRVDPQVVVLEAEIQILDILEEQVIRR